MKDEEIIQKVQELGGEWLTVLSIQTTAYHPHPYVIGPMHIHYSGVYLNIEEAERKGAHCMYPECRLEYSRHTSDRGVFIQLKKNIPNKVFVKFITAVEPIIIAENLKGCCLVETEEKYRVDPPIEIQ